MFSLYTFIAPQAPSGPTGLKVSPLFFEIYMNISIGLGCYLTMEHCASLGTGAAATKQQGSFPEDKEKDPKTQELTGSVKMKKRKHAEIALPDSLVPIADSPVAQKLHCG